MSGPDEEDNLLVAIVELLAAWKAFQQGHDLDSLKMKCCDVSTEFFRAMEQFEEVAMEKIEVALITSQEEDED